MKIIPTTTKGRFLIFLIVLNGLLLSSLKSQTYSTADKNILLAIDAECDPTNMLNWNTEPDPALWTGVLWDAGLTKRVYYLNISEKSLSGILNASGLDSLNELICYANQLTGLNVSGDIRLEMLLCQENQLTSLDISGLNSLDVLFCQTNNLTTLNVSGQTNLEVLNCEYNQLTELNISGLAKLSQLYYTFNSIHDLDISDLTNLTILGCAGNGIDTLDVSAFSNLTHLDCKWNELNYLNVSGLVNLDYLDCWLNNLTVLDLSSLSNLTFLSCADNQLTSLDVSALLGLNTLLCSFNQLTSLDVSACTDLEIFSCDDNHLSVLNTAGLTNITELYCSMNLLSLLDVSCMANLNKLDCHENMLDSLDVSTHTNLVSLICYENKLPFTSLATGLHVSDFRYNPQNILYSPTTFYGDDTIDYSSEALIKDSLTTFIFTKDYNAIDTNTTGLLFTKGEGLYHCRMTNNNFPNLTLTTTYTTVLSPYNSIDVGNLLARDSDCDIEETLNWDVETDPGNWDGVTWDSGEPKRIIQLDISGRSLTGDFDISALDSLKELDCSSNRLIALNLSGLSKLENIDCRHNKLPFSSLATGLGSANYFFNPQDTIFERVTRTVNYAIDYSSEATIVDEATTFVFFKDGIETETNISGLYTCTDLGEYNCHMTNSNFPGMTLITAPVTIADVTGTNTMISGSGTGFYPNPATTEIYFNNPETIREVKILSLTGQVLRKWDSRIAAIQLTGFSKGVYLLQIQTNRATDLQQIVIE
jgi:Leucine-rich repeat (LRR) protein